MDTTDRLTAALAPARIRGDSIDIQTHEDGVVTVTWSGPRIRLRPSDRTLIERTERHATKLAGAAHAALAAEGLTVIYTEAESSENYGDRVRFGVVNIETTPIEPTPAPQNDTPEEPTMETPALFSVNECQQMRGQVDVFEAIAEAEASAAPVETAPASTDGALFPLRVTDESRDGALFAITL